MSDKLRKEDICLTVKQAMELQNLGIDMKDTIFAYYKHFPTGMEKAGFQSVYNEEEYELTLNKGLVTWSYDYVPTLCVSEMTEMLPKKINGWHLVIANIMDDDIEKWAVKYIQNEPNIYNILLRDSLFDMIVWLKKNKQM